MHLNLPSLVPRYKEYYWYHRDYHHNHIVNEVTYNSHHCSEHVRVLFKYRDDVILFGHLWNAPAIRILICLINGEYVVNNIQDSVMRELIRARKSYNAGLMGPHEIGYSSECDRAVVHLLCPYGEVYVICRGDHELYESKLRHAKDFYDVLFSNNEDLVAVAFVAPSRLDKKYFLKKYYVTQDGEIHRASFDKVHAIEQCVTKYLTTSIYQF